MAHPSVANRWNWNTPFILSRHSPMVYYVGANKLFKSVKRGEGLVAISPDLTAQVPDWLRVSSGFDADANPAPDPSGGITRGSGCRGRTGHHALRLNVLAPTATAPITSTQPDAGARQVRIALDQVQEDGSLFTMPLEVAVLAKDQAVPTLHRVDMSARTNVLTFDVPSEPAEVRLDPNLWVLMEATFERERGR